MTVVRRNIEELKAQLAPATYTALLSELDHFSVDPRALDAALGRPSLAKEGTGTHFYIMPADSSLAAAIDERPDQDSAPALKKMLLGFTNTMTPNHPPAQIWTAFRDHRSDDASEELIGEEGFFTPEEFENADHHIEGRFDEYGQFLGSVTVYGEETKDHVVAWDASKGHKTECGPFRINVAYVQGVSSESTLPQNDWAQIMRKLNQIGGLYIYKDNIRILPYGNTDYDFLDIEKRRTKSAAYYYFSFRRMLGIVEISQGNNSQLTEKAGRLGFRENLAYRQFRAILMNFSCRAPLTSSVKGPLVQSAIWSVRLSLTTLNRLGERGRSKSLCVELLLVANSRIFSRKLAAGSTAKKSPLCLNPLLLSFKQQQQ